MNPDVERGPRLAGAVAWPAALAREYRRQGIWAGQTVWEWFERRSQIHAARWAVVDGSRRVTYRELARTAVHIAAKLRGLELEAGDRLVLHLPSGIELLGAFLACQRLGVIPVLALPAHRGVELEAFCRRSGAKALLVPERHGACDMRPIARDLLRDCPDLRLAVVLGAVGEYSELTRLAPPQFTGDPALEAKTIDRPPEQATAGTAESTCGDAAEVALLQLSGGSTGVPKLIPRTHDDYLYSVRKSAALCGVSSETRYLVVLPLVHNFILSSPGVLGVLDQGGTVVISPHPSPDVVLRLIEREGITLVASVPSLARTWVEAHARLCGGRRFDRLVLQVGGAKLDPGLARRIRAQLGCRLQQVFGMAEGLVNYTRLDDPEHVLEGTQGRPLSPHDELRIVDPEDPEARPLAVGQVGELQTRGPYTIRGYFDDQTDGSKHFTEDGYYRTGDLVRLTTEGNLVVEGRLGERILRAGEKVAPLEVEEHVLAHPGVREAAVVGVPDASLGERTHAFVVLAAAESELSLAELRRFLRQRGLAEFKLPDALHPVAALPRTRVGKTNKLALRTQATPPVATPPVTSPSGSPA